MAGLLEDGARGGEVFAQNAWHVGASLSASLLGGFPLFEDFAECQSTGLVLPIVASARIPLDVLYDETDPED